MIKKNVLLLCPKPTAKGGVANYYSLVKKYFVSEKISLTFYYTGKSKNDKINLYRIFKSIFDVVSLINIFSHYDLVILNPSLDPKAIIRDGIFNFIAKRFYKKKTVVFFRGWHVETEKIIEKYFKKLFKLIFLSDKILVLSKTFKKKLIKWGFEGENILTETTTFVHQKLPANNDRYKIIFLSRITKRKGCLEAIKSIQLIVNEFPKLKLFIVGDGDLVPQLKEYTLNHNLCKNIEFKGWMEENNKYSILNQCGIMLLPTSHSEGLPNSLLEGMGMGLAVISRPVGGIPEIIKNGENGFLIETFYPIDFAMKLKFLIKNKEIWETISNSNRMIAKEQFEIKVVVKRLEKLYLSLV